MARRVGLGFGAALAILLTAALAGAETAPSPAGCRSGNLIAGQPPAAWTDLAGLRSLLTDGSVANDGAAWDSFPAVKLATRAAEVTYDLGVPTELRLAYIQADANDTYQVFASLDGVEFSRIGLLDRLPGRLGLQARTADLGGAVARFVRIGEPHGDGFFSISEVQLFCRTPVPFPPVLRVVQAPLTGARNVALRWDDTTSARFELALALAGLLVVGRGTWLARDRAATKPRTLRHALLALLGALSIGAYVNFGSFHFANFVHAWDTFHYYVGAKYHRELEYQHLYECVALADVEAGLGRRVQLRRITNLRTNVIEHTDDVLAHPERCRDRFTDARWQSFKEDVAFFRARMTAKKWEDLQVDHGYNASPVWTMAGTLLANTGPASVEQLTLLAMVDCALLLAAAAMIGWAFGWRILCVALLVFATNFPSRWYWTGGCFLRQDWVFLTVAGTCLAKKGRSLLGGFALGYAALLRIFPVFLLIGPAFVVARQIASTRRIEKRYRDLFAGAALAAALLVPLSIAVAGRPGIYGDFVANTAKHARTPLTNNMGLPTLLSYRPEAVGRHLRSDRLLDPWSEWKAARLAAFDRSRVVYAALLLAGAVLLARGVRGAEPWVALGLGATSIPFAAELTCYYYSFLVVVALLAHERPTVARWLLAITFATQLLAACGLWTDERSILMSAATLAGLTAVVWRFAVVPAPLSGSQTAHPVTNVLAKTRRP